MTIPAAVGNDPVELPLGDFHPESGGVIRDARLRYRIFGDAALGHANGWILVFHALTGNADIDGWWGSVLGPGRALDTSRHAIVAANLLGSCYGSSGPAELSDGSVRLDTRQFGGAKVRKTSVSNDGGKTWSPAAELPELTDPGCMAGLLRYSFDDAAGKGRLLHTGPDSTKRDHGTVWLSTDDGATWPVKRELWPGGFAYSVPAKLDGGTVGVLFEADDYQTIKFARFPVEWVDGK